MKKLSLSLFISLICVFLVSCGIIAGKEQPGKTMAFPQELTGPISKVSIIAGGREAHITDSVIIKEVVDTIKSTSFQLAAEKDIHEPGAVSVQIDVFTKAGTTTITFPRTLTDGCVFEAAADSIQLFEKYIK